MSVSTEYYWLLTFVFGADQTLLLPVVSPETAVSRTLLALLPGHQGHQTSQQEVLLQPRNLNKPSSERGESGGTDPLCWEDAGVTTQRTGDGEREAEYNH